MGFPTGSRAVDPIACALGALCVGAHNAKRIRAKRLDLASLWLRVPPGAPRDTFDPRLQQAGLRTSP